MLLYLLVGFLVGSQASRFFQQKKTKPALDSNDIDKHNKQNRQQNIHHKIKFHKKIKKYFLLESNSPQKINPKNIKIDIKKKKPEKNKSSPEPNFIALTILWSHYIAKQFGLLTKEGPTPWEFAYKNYEDDVVEKKAIIDISQDSWRNFLNKIITDKSWVSWIKNPAEVKSRTLLAFKR